MRVDVETPPCIHCGNRGLLKGVDYDGFERWLDGEFIQEALPMLAPDERELLISGTHAHCWEAIWGGHDDA